MQAKKKVLLMLAVHSSMRKKRATRRRRRFFITVVLNFLNRHRDAFSPFMYEVPQQRRYWMFKYQQNWFENMIANQNDSIFQEFWKKEKKIPSVWMSG